MTASAEAKGVQIVLDEGGHRWPAYLNEAGGADIRATVR
jgi:hypothetical protein